MTTQNPSRTPARRSFARASLVGAASALALALAPVSAARADSVDIVSDRDNTLYQDALGSTSNGAGVYFFVGKTNQADGVNLRRGVLHFDVAAAIPAGSTITGVTLTLVMSRTSDTVARATSLHRVLADWGEGTSDAGGQEGAGAPATTGDATWLHTFFDTQFWSASGGDFDPTPSASTDVGTAVQSYSWSDPAMVADVQSWLDAPADNFGWLVGSDESTAGTARRYSTREDSSNGGGNRPLLTVDYTPPAGNTIFVDGFESGDYCQWSAVVGAPPCPGAFFLQ
jgi:hypothetical protein